MASLVLSCVPAANPFAQPPNIQLSPRVRLVWLAAANTLLTPDVAWGALRDIEADGFDERQFAAQAPARFQGSLEVVGQQANFDLSGGRFPSGVFETGRGNTDPWLLRWATVRSLRGVMTNFDDVYSNVIAPLVGGNDLYVFIIPCPQ